MNFFKVTKRLKAQRSKDSITFERNRSKEAQAEHDIFRAMLSTNLEVLRESKGWTREDLYDESGVSRSMIKYIESIEDNQASPSHSTILRLARALKIHPFLFFIRPSDIKAFYNIFPKAHNFKFEEQTRDILTNKLKFVERLDLNQIADICIGEIDKYIDSSGNAELKINRNSSVLLGSLACEYRDISLMEFGIWLGLYLTKEIMAEYANHKSIKSIASFKFS